MNNGYSKELNVQNVGNFMVISSCSEKRHTCSLICLENWYTFQIRNILLNDGNHMGYTCSSFPSVSSD